MPSTCYTWSLSAEHKFQGLCSMPLKAETQNKTKQCEVCVQPVQSENFCDACVSLSPLMYKVKITMSGVGSVFDGSGGCGSGYNGEFIVHKSGPPGANSCTFFSQERAALVYCDIPFTCNDPDILALAAVKPNPLGGGGPGHEASSHWRVSLGLYKAEVGFNSFVTGYTVTAQWFRYQSGFGSASVSQLSAQARGNGTKLDCWEEEVTLPFVGANTGGGGFSMGASPFGCGIGHSVIMTAEVTPMGTRPA
jgi:hypothetical protein